MEAEMIDNVNKPKHYTSDPSGVECIDIVRHRNFNVGNAIKYLWRAGLKQEADKSSDEKQIEDLNKAIWYIVDEIHRLGGTCTVMTDLVRRELPTDNSDIIATCLNFKVEENQRASNGGIVGKTGTILGTCSTEGIASRIEDELRKIAIDFFIG